MSTPEVSIGLAPSHRCANETEHLARFYDDEEYLLDSVADFLGGALSSGGAGIIIATPGHVQQIEDRWHEHGLDLIGARQRGRYVVLDAAATLEKLLLDGWPQERRFVDVIEPIIGASVRRHGRVRVFGEMVALLCQRGKHSAAIHLEELWNSLGKRHRFGLMCGYPISSFGEMGGAEALRQACSQHSSVVPVEKYSRSEDPSHGMLAIAELQHRTRQLEREVEARLAVEQRLAVRERELSQARESIRSTGHRKDEFIATLAHELRNPLAPIRNAVEIMRVADADRAATTSARQLIERQLKQLVRLIEDLLDVSHITQGRLELRRKKINLAIALQMAIEASRPLIESKQHHLEIRGPREPLFVDADATRLAQVFGNLISNSAKYSPPFSTISVALRAEGDRAVVTVSDTGVGISSDMLPRVFDMFERASPCSESTQDGLGIGLTLVRRLVELHGGHVEVHSDGPDRGSMFTISLPLWCAAGGEELATFCHATECCAAESNLHRVLVVDDSKDTATSMAMMLTLDGHEVRRAYDGIEALEVAEEFRPEVVLLDIGMPRLDGYGTARELRKRPWARELLLVAITGWGQQEDQRRAIEAGFDRHLVKPVEPEIMRRLVEELRVSE